MISLQELEVFRAVVAEGSVSAAGQRLNLSQPSVSRILSDFERKIGFTLFRRRSKGMVPTPEAQFFLKEVQQTYAAISSLEQTAREIAQGRRGALSLVVNYAASLDLAPRALARMNVAERDLSVICQCKSSDWIIEFARSGMIKTGVANLEHMPKGMKTRFTSSTPHMCLLPSNDPLAGQSASISLTELRGRKLVTPTGAVSAKMSLADLGMTTSNPITAETSFSAIQIASHIGAVPIADAFTSYYWIGKDDVVALPVHDLPYYQMAIFAPSGVHLSALDEELQNSLETEIRAIEELASKPIRGSGNTHASIMKTKP